MQDPGVNPQYHKNETKERREKKGREEKGGEKKEKKKGKGISRKQI